MPYDSSSSQHVDRIIMRFNALIKTQEQLVERFDAALTSLKASASESKSAAYAAWLAAGASALAAIANVVMAYLMWGGTR